MLDLDAKDGFLLNGHLSEDQMGALLTGDPAPAATAHLAACTRCSKEFTSLKAALGNYREAVIPFAEAASQRARFRASRLASTSVTPQRACGWGFAGWAVTAAAALALVGTSVGGYRSHTAASVAPVAITSGTSGSASDVGTSGQADDERLLSDINQDLATSLPPSLAPLNASSSAPANTSATAR